MKLKTIDQIRNLTNQRVLLRVDFNVPFKHSFTQMITDNHRSFKHGSSRIEIGDDTRIRAALPTIKYLIKKRAKVIIISHLGQPIKNQKSKAYPREASRVKNQRLENKIKLENKIRREYTLEPVARRLEKLLHKKVNFIDDCFGPKVKETVDKMKPGEIIFLENLRFYPEEENNSKLFVKQLASGADLYVNDAFSVSHRAHSSVAAITQYLPSYAGLLLSAEIDELSRVLKPKRPAIAILGGAKISTKIKLIENLIKKFDKVLVAGALANNFIKAAGWPIGKSLVDADYRLNLKKYNLRRLVLPLDVKIKIKSGNQEIVKNIKLEDLKNFKNQNFVILDIGEETIDIFSHYLVSAKTIVWNGPLGYFEDKRFIVGTRKIVKAVLKNKKARIVIGGGETIAAIKLATYNLQLITKKNVFISSGGGAMLEFLAGKTLPGLRPLYR